MCSLHNPTPRPVAWNLLPLFCLVSSGGDVNCVFPVLKQFADLGVVVAFIHAHVLRRFTCRFRFLSYDAFQGGLREFHIMPIRAIHGQPNRYAVAFNEEAAFRSGFPSICRVGACIFFPREALWSSLHPSLATPSQALSSRHTPSTLSSIGVGRHQPYPTLGIGRGRCLTRRSLLVAPSIGTRFGEHRR